MSQNLLIAVVANSTVSVGGGIAFVVCIFLHVGRLICIWAQVCTFSRRIWFIPQKFAVNIQMNSAEA